MTKCENTPPSRNEVYEAIRRLECKGFLVSKLCDDGQIRWFATGKPHYEDEWDDGPCPLN